MGKNVYIFTINPMDSKLSNFIGLWILVIWFMPSHGQEMNCWITPAYPCNSTHVTNPICSRLCIPINTACSTCHTWRKTCETISIPTIIPNSWTIFTNKTNNSSVVHLTSPTPVPPCIEQCIYTCIANCSEFEFIYNNICYPCSTNCSQGCYGNTTNCIISPPLREYNNKTVVTVVVAIIISVIVLGILIVVFIVWKRHTIQTQVLTASKTGDTNFGKKKKIMLNRVVEEHEMLYENTSSKLKTNAHDAAANSCDQLTRYTCDPTFRKHDFITPLEDQEIYENVTTDPNPIPVCNNKKIDHRTSEEQIAQLPNAPPIPILSPNTSAAAWDDYVTPNNVSVDIEEIYHLPQAPPIPVVASVNTAIKVPSKQSQVLDVALSNDDDQIYQNLEYSNQQPEGEDHYCLEDPNIDEVYENISSSIYHNT